MFFFEGMNAKTEIMTIFLNKNSRKKNVTYCSNIPACKF